MEHGTGPRDESRAQHAHVARLIGHVRWGGVVLGVVQALLATSPLPIGGTAGVLAPALLMAAYNLPVLLAGRMPEAWVRRVAVGALAGDFLAVTAWTFLTANDIYSTSYAAYAMVAIEAATLYRWRGSGPFIAAFCTAFAAYYWFRDAAFHFAPLAGSVIYRSGIIVLTAVFVAGLAEASERRRQRYGMLLQTISDLGEGLVVSEAGRFLYCNEAYERLTGYGRVELAALPSLTQLAPDAEQQAAQERVRRLVAGSEPSARRESRLVRRDGSVIDIETVSRPLPAEGTERLISVVRDISERKRAENALQDSERRAREAARVDPLTGLANRRAWNEEMERAMARARRDGAALTVGLMDLDGFKAYNDDWGHAKGDQLLCAFAEHWRQPLREVDTIARYGGDEFSVLLSGSTLDQARVVIDRLRAVSTALPSFSVGLARWDGVETMEALMSRADAALYRSKRAGPGRVAASATSQERVQSWSYLIPRLLDGRELAAVYQPIQRLDDYSIVGHEALARPAGFGARSSVEDLFDAAKRLGFARDLDWLCRRTAVHGAALLDRDQLLFINVSVHALLDPLHDVDQMQLLMDSAGRAPETVVFEISERDQVADLARLRAVMSAYRGEGFRFALDDVGEGHSTLEVLSTAAPEFIKVARSLATNATAAGSRSALEALTAFARSSGAQLIAEGLETDAQIRAVRELGVTLGQGYGLAEPRAAARLALMRTVA